MAATCDCPALGAGRHRPAGDGRGGDGVEQLPGHPLERRAGQGGQPDQRHPHRRGPGPERGRRPRPQVDVATFIQWVDANAHDDEDLADFYEARFRDEFQPAFDAWLATDPLVNPDAPADAVRHAGVQVEAQSGGRPDLDQQAEASAATVRRDIVTGQQLRPGRRALRRGPVLRRDQHQAGQSERLRAWSCSWSATPSSSGPWPGSPRSPSASSPERRQVRPGSRGSPA